MPGIILIIGATGNTGKPAVIRLSTLLTGSGTPILALTRNVDSSSSQELAKLEGVSVEGKEWTEIDEIWLRERKVEKVR